MDLRSKLRSGMIAVTTGEKYLVLTDCDTVNYGRQTFCLVNATGFMTGNIYREDLSYRTEYYSINALYKATVDGETYEELKILDETLTAICGHGIEYLVNLAEVR